MDQVDRPVQYLKNEHQLILGVLKVLATLMDRYDRQGEFAVEPLRQCITFFRLFADACHHGKEEDLLFPVLEARGIPREGGPIGVMLYEHTEGRRLTREMGDALAAFDAGDYDARSRFSQTARQYVSLLTNHIFKEDNILFNMGDRVMTPDDQAALASQFCSVNCKAFDGQRREQLTQIAEDLKAAWGTH